jgi:hypothetical protein
MANSYGRMTDDPFCCWCRLMPKDLPAGAHSGIVGTALFCSFQRPHDGSWRKMRKKIILMVIGLSYSEELNYSDEFYRYCSIEKGTCRCFINTSRVVRNIKRRGSPKVYNSEPSVH